MPGRPAMDTEMDTCPGLLVWCWRQLTIRDASHSRHQGLLRAPAARQRAQLALAGRGHVLGHPLEGAPQALEGPFDLVAASRSAAGRARQRGAVAAARQAQRGGCRLVTHGRALERGPGLLLLLLPHPSCHCHRGQSSRAASNCCRCEALSRLALLFCSKRRSKASKTGMQRQRQLAQCGLAAMHRPALLLAQAHAAPKHRQTAFFPNPRRHAQATRCLHEWHTPQPARPHPSRQSSPVSAQGWAPARAPLHPAPGRAAPAGCPRRPGSRGAGSPRSAQGAVESGRGGVGILRH